MPDTKSPGDSTPEEEKSGGPKKLIMSLVVCIVLLGVGAVLGGKFLGGGTAVAEDGAETEATAEGEAGAEEGADAEAEAEEEVGEVVDLEAINVNLAEGRYLRIAVSLGLSHDIELVDSHGAEIEFPVAPASDVILTTFSGLTMAELSSHEGRESARVHLAEELHHFYGEDVLAIYFTEFVMQ